MNLCSSDVLELAVFLNLHFGICNVQELRSSACTVLELVHEVQMACSRTSVVQEVQEQVQELVHGVQMAGSRTSEVLEVQFFKYELPLQRFSAEEKSNTTEISI